RAHARERVAPPARAGRGASPRPGQGPGAAAAHAARGGRAAHPVYDGAPPRHRRDARRARREDPRDPRPPSHLRPHPGGHRPGLPRQADDPARRRARARGARRRAHRGARPPRARPRGERAGAAQPLARRPRAAARRRAQRLGRHLAPHPRLREPRGPVAARARARGHLRRGGLRARRAAADLPGVRRAAGLSRPRAPRARAGAPVRTVLEPALAGRPPTVAEGERLLAATGPDLLALVRTADAVRAADVGDTVTYVVNRNINFTNVCFVNCRFCAFKRQRWEHDAYTHGLDVVLAKVEEAIARGATEVCMQGGINPEMDAFAYRDLLLAIKGRFPRVHVHAFSPMEIMYG